jgi:hypothetical protein
VGVSLTWLLHFMRFCRNFHLRPFEV